MTELFANSVIPTPPDDIFKLPSVSCVNPVPATFEFNFSLVTALLASSVAVTPPDVNFKLPSVSCVKPFPATFEFNFSLVTESFANSVDVTPLDDIFKLPSVSCVNPLPATFEFNFSLVTESFVIFSVVIELLSIPEALTEELPGWLKEIISKLFPAFSIICCVVTLVELCVLFTNNIISIAETDIFLPETIRIFVWIFWLNSMYLYVWLPVLSNIFSDDDSSLISCKLILIFVALINVAVSESEPNISFQVCSEHMLKFSLNHFWFLVNSSFFVKFNTRDGYIKLPDSDDKKYNPEIESICCWFNAFEPRVLSKFTKIEEPYVTLFWYVNIFVDKLLPSNISIV